MESQKPGKNCCDNELLYITVISAINILYHILHVTRILSIDVYRKVHYSFYSGFNLDVRKSNKRKEKYSGLLLKTIIIYSRYWLTRHIV
jgi:hypothetical protein